MVFSNTIAQVVGKCITAGTTFLVTILIAKALGVSLYGQFTLIAAFLSPFLLLLDFGVNAIVLQREHPLEFFRDVFFARLVAAAGITIVVLVSFYVFVSIRFSPQDVSTLTLAMAIFSLSAFSFAVQQTSAIFFQHRLRYELQTIASTIGSLFTIGLLLTFLVISPTLPLVILAIVVGGFVTGGVGLFFTHQSLSPIRIEKHVTVDILKKSLPLGLMLLCNLIYFRFDTIILSAYDSPTAVGIYGFAYRFFDFLIALPLFLSNALYPLLLAHEKNSRKDSFSFPRYTFIFFGLSLVLVVLFWFLSPLFVLVRSEFAPSVLPFRILLVSLPIFFVTNFFQWVLISQRQMRYLLSVYVFSAVFNIVLNIVVIPVWSYNGAAILTGVSETVVLVLLVLRLRTFANISRKTT